MSGWRVPAAHMVFPLAAGGPCYQKIPPATGYWRLWQVSACHPVAVPVGVGVPSLPGDISLPRGKRYSGIPRSAAPRVVSLTADYAQSGEWGRVAA